MASFSLDGKAGWSGNDESWKSFQPLGRNWDFGSVDWSAEVPTTIVAAKHETDPPGEVYVNGDGIHRSTDSGASWTKVSSVNPQTRIPVLFGGRHYLGWANGLLVSADRGATWKELGTLVNVWLGPFFGRNEKELAVVGDAGIFLSTDAGTTWKKAADLKPNANSFKFTPNWFGCYAWDPVHHTLYASSMGNSVYRLKL